MGNWKKKRENWVSILPTFHPNDDVNPEPARNEVEGRPEAHSLKFGKSTFQAIRRTPFTIPQTTVDTCDPACCIHVQWDKSRPTQSTNPPLLH